MKQLNDCNGLSLVAGTCFLVLLTCFQRTQAFLTPSLRNTFITNHARYPFSSSVDLAVSENNNNDNNNNVDDGVLPLEQDGPKFLLLQALEDQRERNDNVAGFGASSEDRSKISSFARDLGGSYVLPLEIPSEWELLYNDAPDFLGYKGGPLSQLVSVKQKIMNDIKLNIVLEYKPSDGIISLTKSIFENIQEDRLEQAIIFDYQKEPMNKISLTIKGTKIDGTRFGTMPSLEGPVSLPFGSFNVLFNDGELCMQETLQGGYLFIYQRI